MQDATEFKLEMIVPFSNYISIIWPLSMQWNSFNWLPKQETRPLISIRFLLLWLKNPTQNAGQSLNGTQQKYSIIYKIIRYQTLFLKKKHNLKARLPLTLQTNLSCHRAVVSRSPPEPSSSSMTPTWNVPTEKSTLLSGARFGRKYIHMKFLLQISAELIPHSVSDHPLSG